ncbi:hypothetical protein, variant [Aphanomyces invadans]|uniref:Uncharacterized protein n=1 Tax=Aphanomyces invadans TaxID=157072 RepID=A0A024TJ37_9STRA|nr:hypothetical protein, variant [Aphanomyces invadans]ETV94175.1 hypothetical protein, variant [Aphanomyces invadans]|eukprot:XP_008877377.1 hypothetical protein, variant [Aphanomyces invadans]
MSDASSTSAASSCLLPLDTALIHKYGMEFHALLTMDGPGAKKKSKMTGVVFHPVRPWVAAVESKDVGIVWNYETKEVIKRFTLQIGDEIPASSDDPATVATPPSVVLTKSMALSSTFSPKLGKAKSTAVLLFFDREAISHASGISRGIDCFEEWLVILTTNNIVFCDINDSQSNRWITSDELGRALPNSIELLPGGFLAIGCSDGKIRIWSPRLGKVCHVIDMGTVKEIPFLILVPSDASSTPTVSPSTFRCYLIAVHVDGKAIVWCVNRLANAEFQQSRACEFDLKDANKRGGANPNVDLTSCGFHELRLLVEDSVLTAVSKDGNVLMWDVSFLRITQQTKEPRVNFIGVFHTSNATAPVKPLHGTLLLGSSKHSYVYLSSCHTSMMNVTELHKGKANADMEIAAHRVDVVKDVRNLHTKLSKKIKINTMSQSPRSANLIAAATNYGLLLFSMHSYTRHTATLVPSAAAIVLNTSTHLRSVGLAEKGKREMHALKYPNKDSVGVVMKHSTSNYVAVLTGTHYEIVHVDAAAATYRMTTPGQPARVPSAVAYYPFMKTVN